MKRLFLFLFLLCISGVVSQAQLLPINQPEQDACNAIEICGNTFTSSFSYQGIGQVSDLTNTPCFGGEGNVVWFRMNVVTAGIIVFTISPLNLTDDYDFAVIDITGKTCSTFTQSDVIRCNFNNNWPGSNVNGVVGLNTTSTSPFTTAGATGGSFLQQINANAGDVYLIMINNFGDPFVGGPSSGFTLDFTGTTATFNGPVPSLVSVIPSCNNAQQITVQTNHNILCNSIAADGTDFTVAGGTIASATGVNCGGTNGYTDKIVINFAAPLPPGTYNLVAQIGSNGNTLLNTCNIPLPVGAFIPFTVDPYEAPAYQSVVQPACTEFRVKMNKRIACGSIASNGSDFSLSGPQSASVVAAYGIGCDTLNFTDTVVFIVQPPLQTDGVYTIKAGTGSDLNTLLDSCGVPQSLDDNISFSISSYDGLVIALTDTILCDAQYISLDLINHSTLPPQPVTCGTATLPCGGSTMAAFVGGRDSITAANSPFFGGAEDQRAQYLFLASELRERGLKPGMITSLEWLVVQKLSSFSYSNFTIKMMCTSGTSLSALFPTGAQTVYAATSHTTTTGWNTFNLTTPFAWDGTSNLIIETCFDNLSSSLSDEVAHDVTPFVSVLRRSGFGLSGCAITLEGTLGGQRNLRPKVRFSICEPPAGEPIVRWSPGTLLSDSTVKSPLAYISENITYHLSVTDKYGCAHRDSAEITLSLRDPKIIPTDTTICFGERVPLIATGGVEYLWLAADPSSLTCLDCATTHAAPKETSIYQVVISDQYHCADTLASVVNVNPLPPVDILEENMVVKYGTELTLHGDGAYLYSWSPSGKVSDPYGTAPTTRITEPITFYLSGIDKNGCRNIDSVTITPDYTDKIFIPTAFTPNGDGRNDIFKAGSVSFQKLQEFRIFNRWGQQVFYTTDINDGWDGSFNGVPQNPGVYYYIIRLAYPGGKVEVYKGDVTLIR